MEIIKVKELTNPILKLAIKINIKTEFKRYNLTSIITNKQDKILSVGINSYTKTHPLQVKFAKKFRNYFKIYLHSEIDAISKCKSIPYRIYVVRTNKQGKIASAKPCPICEYALNSVGIKEVFHT